MLQILFAIILFESECVLYLHRQEYSLPHFCSKGYSVVSRRGAATCIPFSGEKSRFEVLQLGGQQGHWEAWMTEDGVQ